MRYLSLEAARDTSEFMNFVPPNVKTGLSSIFPDEYCWRVAVKIGNQFWHDLEIHHRTRTAQVSTVHISCVLLIVRG